MLFEYPYGDWTPDKHKARLPVPDEVIDAHCHIYPDKIALRATKGTEAFYDGLHAAADGSVSMLIENGRAAGITHYVIQSVATSPAQVSGINHFIADTMNASNGTMTGLGTLHPDSTHLREDVEEIISLGLHGVKLHHDIQGFKIDDYRCLKIYELCEGRLPILMHTGDHRYDFSNPNRLLPVLKIFTELTVVGAHLGGWSVWEDTEALSALPNLYVDCSSCFPFSGPDAMLPTMRRFGAEKILFGTDYPLWSPERELQAFLSLPFTKEEQHKILFENACRVFSISKKDKSPM